MCEKMCAKKRVKIRPTWPPGAGYMDRSRPGLDRPGVQHQTGAPIKPIEPPRV